MEEEWDFVFFEEKGRNTFAQNIQWMTMLSDQICIELGFDVWKYIGKGINCQM